jgi:hypothetical protein
MPCRFPSRKPKTIWRNSSFASKAARIVARIVAAEATPDKHTMTQEERRRVLDEVMAKAPPRAPGEPTADRSHDYLYDEDGLPA